MSRMEWRTPYTSDFCLKLVVFLIFSLFLGIGLSSSGLAADYYVAVGGSDSYNGLYPSFQSGANGPFRTIGRAAAAVQAGDTVRVRGGIYHEKVALNAKGTASSRITITNYNGETPVVDGEYTLPGGSVYYFLVNISGEYITISNLTIRRSSGGLLALSGNYCRAVNIVGNGSRETGMVAAGHDNVFDACTMTDNGNGYGLAGQTTWGSAICTVGANNTIQNCVSHDNRGEGLNAYRGSSNSVIQDNISYDNGCGVYLDSTNGAIVRRNLFYTSAKAFASGRRPVGIAIGGETGEPKNLVIVNNLCLGNWLNLVSDSNVETADNWIIAYNTLVNSQKTAEDIASGYNMNIYFRPQLANFVNSIFQNNIIIEEDTRQVPINKTLAKAHAGFTFSHNCWNKNPVSAAHGEGDVIGDPLLAKTGSTEAGKLTAEWFEIMKASPARDRGESLRGLEDDFLQNPRGNHPDIGAFEFTSNPSLDY